MQDNEFIDDLLSCNAGDVWDNLDAQVVKTHEPLIIRAGQTVTIRMLGPFLHATRFYVNPISNLRDLVTQQEIIEIVKQNQIVFEGVRKRIFTEGNKYSNPSAPRKNNAPKKAEAGTNLFKFSETSAAQAGNKTQYPFPNKNPLSPKEKMFHEALTSLDTLYGLHVWQNVLIVNSLVIDADFGLTDRLRPFCLTDKMALDLFKSILDKSKDEEDAGKKKISGLKAYDFTISRIGNGTKTKYNIVMSDAPSKTSGDNISNIFQESLVDLKKSCFQINKVFSRNRQNFVFKVKDDYRMAVELMVSLSQERNEFIDKEHLEEIDKHIHELPDDAFDDDCSNPINTIEF